jgi:NitT/TauT family transport system ATP-binding protein
MINHNASSALTGHIKIDNVSVRFGSNGSITNAATNVSLEVKPGEFVSIIGPSGCGKSTLLNIVAGFLKPSEGSALLDGKPINGPGADRGVVFQQYSLFPWMSVRKNVEFGLKMKGISLHQRESAARSLLGMAGLLAFENHYPDQLSGGMKQRVGIVRALATSPQVMLMDEPFGALDSQTRMVMQEILTNMWQKMQLSVLFVTHDIEEAIFLSEKVYVMTARPGRIKAEIHIPLPRPRTPEMVATPTFQALVRQLKTLIREESLAAMGGELGQSGLQGFDHEFGKDGMSALI